jgi:hypothetical protein
MRLQAPDPVDELVIVSVVVAKIGTTSFDLEYQLRRQRENLRHRPRSDGLLR